LASDRRAGLGANKSSLQSFSANWNSIFQSKRTADGLKENDLYFRLSELGFLFLAAALTVGSLSAQDAGSFVYEARQQFKSASENLLKSAEEMPAPDYAFRPTPDSPSFGDWVDEAAASQANVCSAVDGKSIQDKGFYAKDKAELVEKLRRVIGKCDSAYGSVNNFTASQEMRFGNSRHSRLGLLFMNASHENEVYGHMAVYLRLKGLVPPDSWARVLPVTSVP
jgi:hypothetical protein